MMNKIEKWANDEVILVNMSGVSFKEAKAGNNEERKNKADRQIYTLTCEFIDFNDSVYLKIAAALFPQGTQNENECNDVKIVYEAMRYSAILVTQDGNSRSQPGGILGNREKLKDVVRILSPDEAINFISEKISERDEFNRRVASEFGGQLPEWTGKD